MHTTDALDGGPSLVHAHNKRGRGIGDEVVRRIVGRPKACKNRDAIAGDLDARLGKVRSQDLNRIPCVCKSGGKICQLTAVEMEQTGVG